jgi:hypothetical protein
MDSNLSRPFTAYTTLSVNMSFLNFIVCGGITARGAGANLANVLQNSAMSTNVVVSDIFDLFERRNIFLSLYLSKNAKITLPDCAYNDNINISNKHPCAEKKHHRSHQYSHQSIWPIC